MPSGKPIQLVGAPIPVPVLKVQVCVPKGKKGSALIDNAMPEVGLLIAKLDKVPTDVKLDSVVTLSVMYPLSLVSSLTLVGIVGLSVKSL